jgi:hypothetical protein
VVKAKNQEQEAKNQWENEQEAKNKNIIKGGVIEAVPLKLNKILSLKRHLNII